MSDRSRPRPRLFWLWVFSAALGGCADNSTALLGTLERDRVALTAEAAEPVLRWHVAEGDAVEAGALLLELDPARAQARLERATAQVAEAEALFTELSHGARRETIDAARAALGGAHAAASEAEREHARIAELRQRGLVAASAADQASANRARFEAERVATEARLRELTRGTRPEQIERAAAAVDAARASQRELALNLARLEVRAPGAGRVDALPFKPGEPPPTGATVASLLVGSPYARVFVPAPQRAGLAPGQRMRVEVEGIATPFDAELRSIRSEPSFTPYYALAGDDAARLVYRAELVLHGEDLDALPAGLPVRAWPLSDDLD